MRFVLSHPSLERRDGWGTHFIGWEGWATRRMQEQNKGKILGDVCGGGLGFGWGWLCSLGGDNPALDGLA